MSIYKNKGNKQFSDKIYLILYPKVGNSTAYYSKETSISAADIV